MTLLNSRKRMLGFSFHIIQSLKKETTTSRNRFFSSLVSSQWLSENLKTRQDLAVLDCSSFQAYNRAHIPGARFLPYGNEGWKKANMDPQSPKSTDMIQMEEFETLMTSIGIHNDMSIVCYDGEKSLRSTRLWWCLRYFGHDKNKVKVLDGGWNNWILENRSVSNVVEQPYSFQLPYKANTLGYTRLITLKDVQENIKTNQMVPIDTRSLGEFQGTNKVGNANGGHIPHAIHYEWHQSISNNNDKFKSKEELQQLLKLPKKPIYTYCQMGIRAAHTAFVAEEILGHPQVQVYDASMKEYLNLKDS